MIFRALALSAVVASLEAWVFMLLIGGIHSHVPEDVPSMSYAESAWTVAVLNSLALIIGGVVLSRRQK